MYEMAGLLTTSQGAYFWLLIKFGSLIIVIPEVVFPKNRYDLLIIYNLLIKYDVEENYKESEFTI